MHRRRTQIATWRDHGATRPLGVALFLALTLIAIGPEGARAATVRYAGPSGSGPQPCLQAAPCSLQTALTGTGVNGVHDGDVVVLEPGTYHLTSGIAFEHVSSVGGEAGAPTPLIESSGSFGLEPGGPVDVHDLRIGQAPGPGIGLTLLNGSIAERVYVTSYDATGGTAACLLFGTVTLRDSLCENAAKTGDGAGVTATTGFGSSPIATLENVTAVGPEGISVRSEKGSAVKIEATNVIASGSIDDLVLRTDSESGTSSTIRLSHSDFSTHAVEGSGNTFTSASARQNVSADPLFVDPAGGDFHQAPGSPTIAAGDLLVVQPGDLDLDRTARSSALTCGAAPTVDIGAYQSRPGECASPPSSATAGSSSSAAVAPSSPSPAGPRVRVRCPAGAKPGGCRLALQVVSAKPHKRGGKGGGVIKPKPESAVARIKLGAGKSALVTLTPKPRYAAKLATAHQVLVRYVETIAGATHTSYRRLKATG